MTAPLSPLPRQDYAYPFRVDNDLAADRPGHVPRPRRADGPPVAAHLPGRAGRPAAVRLRPAALVFAPMSDALAATVQLRVLQAVKQWLAGIVSVTQVAVVTSDENAALRTGHIAGHASYTVVETQTSRLDHGDPAMTAARRTIDRRQYLLGSEARHQRHRLRRGRHPGPDELRVHFLNRSVKGTLGQGIARLGRPRRDDHRRGGRSPRSPCCRSTRPPTGAPTPRPGRCSPSGCRLRATSRPTSSPCQQRARPVLRLGAVLVQGQLPQRLRLRRRRPRRARRPKPPNVPIDYLAKDFAQLRAGAVRVLDAALSRHGWSGPKPTSAWCSWRRWRRSRRAQLLPGPGRRRSDCSTTATQRLSLVRHARLVDYEPAPATVATVLLQLDVDTAISAINDARALPGAGRRRRADRLRSRRRPCRPDDRRRGRVRPRRLSARAGTGRTCSPTGGTSRSAACRPARPACTCRVTASAWLPGQQLLIDTAGPTSADPPVREIVRHRAAPIEVSDPVFGVPLTQVTLAAPTTFGPRPDPHVLRRQPGPGDPGSEHERDLHDPRPRPGGHAGQRVGGRSCGSARIGPRRTRPHYRYCPGHRAAGLDRRYAAPRPTSRRRAPPGRRSSLSAAGTAQTAWTWVRWLLDAEPGDAAFTLDARAVLAGADRRPP